MYLDSTNESKECFANKWGLVSLAKLGHEVTLICGGDINCKTRKEYIWNGIKVIELPTLIGLNNTTRLLKGITKELMEIKADIFHTHHYCSFIPEITALIGKLRRIPTFITYHTTFHGRSGIPGILEIMYSIFMQPTFILYKKMFFISKYIKDSWHFKFVRKSKKKVTYNHFPKINETDKKNNIINEKKRNTKELLFIGRITYLKGIDILIKALAIVKKQVPNLNLTLIGPEEYNFKEKLNKLSKKTGVYDNVTFVGPLYGKEKFNYLHNSDILIVPSRGEGFGNVVIEGMLCGIPVITSNKGALPEAGGGNSLIFEINSPKDLASKIIKLLNDKELNSKLSREGKSYANRFTQEIIGEDLTKEYENAIRKTS